MWENPINNPEYNMANSSKQKFSKVNWQVIIERKQSLFITVSLAKSASVLLKKSTECGVFCQLYVYVNGMATYYRSASELKKVYRFYLKVADKNYDKYIEWKNLGMKYNKIANKLIGEFSKKADSKKIRDCYNETLNECENVLLYGTVIPFFVLSAINAAVKKHPEKTKKYQKAIDLFEPLRTQSYYPQMADTVFVSFWKAAADFCGVDNYLNFSFLTPYELGEIFENKKKFNINEIKKRKKWCAFWLNKNQKIEFNYDSGILNKFGIKRMRLKNISSFRGNIACKGIARGHVCIVNDIEDAKNFKENDIVVSINTNPSLMPVLIKCSGIVTNEVGIMCHAAIVSRETNKPCIIGTKIATKILKNGDLVEVDANKGIVKILKTNLSEYYDNL